MIIIANQDQESNHAMNQKQLTDKNGIPLSVVITAANTHDMKAAIRTLDRVVLRKRPKDTQNLCLDKGYDFPEIEHESVNRGYTPHIRHRGEGRRVAKNVLE